jgi:polyphosphate kinase 2 (PPK2 family)
MKLNREVLAEMKVKPGESAGLDARSTKRVASDWLGSQDKGKTGTSEKRKKVAEEDLGEFVDELAAAQELLWANGTYSLLIVLQAMDAAGKDGTIKHVMSGVNPQGCRVEAFKQPSAEELGHDFLVAMLEGAARARRHQHLQPLLLRGRAGDPGAPRTLGQDPRDAE